MPSCGGDVSGLQARPLRLFALSFLMLFVELALIRWTAANDIHLAYLTNFVLLASFLGIGIGFLREARARAVRVGPVALAACRLRLALPGVGGPGRTFVGRVRLAGAAALGGARRGVPLDGRRDGDIGHGVARTFVHFPPLEAYRLDIIGSIAGIAVFSLISFLDLPPIAWGVIASLLLRLFVGRRWQPLALVAIVALLAVESSHGNDHWSPYYKVTAVYQTHPPPVHGVRTHDTLTISANNIPYQTAYR